jgi:hypothetical protein
VPETSYDKLLLTIGIAWMQKTQRIDDSSSGEEDDDDDEDSPPGAMSGIPLPNNAGRSYRTTLPSTQQGPPQGFKR